MGDMAGDADHPARHGQEGTAVSSGESSAAMPKPALDSDALTMAGIPDPDVTQAGTQMLPASARQVSPAPTGKRDSSNEVTMAGARPRRESSSGVSNQIFAAIGATVLEVGTVLGGRYEIQKLLGMGGMGAVYKAHDLEVDRTVGLKVIRPDLAGNPAILARFKQELVLARQVTHRNIIRIYDLNEADGVKFITMEFIEGEDLRSILTRQGKLPPKEAVDIMRQSCLGLQAAHQEGVIHRDLKPSNIMQDASGRVVIMDFGLAKTVQGDGMTQTGMMIGTMEYMSPEQAMGSDLDAPLRHLHDGPDFLRAADREHSVPRRERHRQPGETDAGTGCSAIGHRSHTSARAEPDRGQVPGAGSQCALQQHPGSHR